MIYSVRGKVIATEPELVVVECAGVGYACRTSFNTIPWAQEVFSPGPQQGAHRWRSVCRTSEGGGVQQGTKSGPLPTTHP